MRQRQEQNAKEQKRANNLWSNRKGLQKKQLNIGDIANDVRKNETNEKEKWYEENAKYKNEKYQNAK